MAYKIKNKKLKMQKELTFEEFLMSQKEYKKQRQEEVKREMEAYAKANGLKIQWKK